MLKGAIISTGTELVTGAVTDTNATYLSAELFKIGFDVNTRYTVGDNREQLAYVLQESVKNHHLTIMSGGLGPTEDDLTVDVICQLWDLSIEYADGAYNKIESFLMQKGRNIQQSDYRMARVPENSCVLDNNRGFAPGFVLQLSGNYLVALPGVPSEMRYIFENGVKNFIDKTFPTVKNESLTYRITGLGEAEVDNRVKNLKLDFLKFNWGITANSGYNSVTFRSADNHTLPVDEIDYTIKNEFGNYIILQNCDTPEMELIRILTDKNMTIACAESCTGGWIQKNLTDIPGSSAAVKGGVVVYSNELKKKLLLVTEDLLNKYGAVSTQTALAMAEGCRNLCNSEIAISVTGIAGPDGGSEEKPVGTVCFALVTNDVKKVWQEKFAGNREQVRYRSVVFIMARLRGYLLGYEK